MRWLPPIFFVGILLNVVLCLVFRLRVERAANDRFEAFRDRAFVGIANLTTNALASIDTYFLSNKVAIADSPSSSFSSSSSSVSVDDFPILRNAGTWKYQYFEVGNNRFARVGIRNYGEGDFFPRGGLITNIHPDGVVVDGKYWVANSSSESSREDVKQTLKDIKK